MLSRVLNHMGLHTKPLYGLNHIKNMWDANLAAKAQEMNDKAQLVETTNRVYKPSYPIEFDRTGQVLL